MITSFWHTLNSSECILESNNCKHLVCSFHFLAVLECSQYLNSCHVEQKKVKNWLWWCTFGSEHSAIRIGTKGQVQPNDFTSPTINIDYVTFVGISLGNFIPSRRYSHIMLLFLIPISLDILLLLSSCIHRKQTSS